MKINVTLLQPLGRIHSFALLEVAEYLFFKTRNAGHDVALSKNRVIHDGMNIVLGSYSKPLEAINLPPQTVIFNSEILGNEKVLAKQGYGDVLEKFYVWDYSQSNLGRIPHENKSLINLGYEPNLARLDNSAPKEIDLLFYGSLNDRRISMLEDLSASGIKWHHPYGVYGRERDELIEQSKAVLNLHYYEEEIFQQIRCFYPLTNGFPVISENWAAGSAPDFYDEAVFKPGKTPFTQFVRDLLQNPKEFETAAARKIKAFKNSAKLDTFEAELERTLDHFKGQKSRRSSKQAERKFSRMNLGSGKDYRLVC